ncbi:MAG: PAS domain S-box protein [Candidatus Hydrothermarchaeales archaeon]
MKLSETEEFLRSLIEGSADCIITTDIDRKITSWNRGSEEILGYKAEDIIGKPISILYPSELKNRRREWQRRVMKGETIRNQRTRVYNSAGELVDINLTISPLRDRKGNPIGTVGIAKDIRHVIKAEEEIKRLKEFNENIVKNAPVGIFTTDKNGVITSANPMHLKMMGEISMDQSLGLNVLELPSIKAKGWDKLFRQALQGEAFELHNEEYTSFYGKTVYLSARCTPLKDEKRQVKGLLVVLEDVTEQARLEEEIRKSGEYLQKLIEASPYCIVSTDLKGEIISFNKAAEETYGYKAEEVMGKHAKILQPKEITVEKNKEIYEAMLKQEGWEGELLNVRKNGEVFPTYLRTRSIVDDRGNPVGLLSLSQDITERKKMEQNLKNYTLELERSNQIKDLFTDIIRHDLLNPVGIILNLLELIEDTDSYRGIEEELQMIKRNTKTLQEMIEDASEYARVDSIDDFVFEKIDLSKIIKDAVDSLHGLASEKGITIENAVTGGYPAYVNPFIKDVFFNIVSNAIKYSPENSRVIVDLKDAGTEWIISVKDNGIGISDEYKEKIFLRFKRVSKEGVRGSGLGLAIVNRIVDLHNGSVWVEDNPGGGSVFNVKLPKRTKK